MAAMLDIAKNYDRIADRVELHQEKAQPSRAVS
jgi:hypothetical protein